MCVLYVFCSEHNILCTYGRSISTTEGRHRDDSAATTPPPLPPSLPRALNDSNGNEIFEVKVNTRTGSHFVAGARARACAFTSQSQIARCEKVHNIGVVWWFLSCARTLRVEARTKPNTNESKACGHITLLHLQWLVIGLITPSTHTSVHTHTHETHTRRVACENKAMRVLVCVHVSCSDNILVRSVYIY